MAERERCEECTHDVEDHNDLYDGVQWDTACRVVGCLCNEVEHPFAAVSGDSETGGQR